jgi:hypothetical protein
MFPQGSPIGNHYSRGGDRNIEVIGIVKDVKVDHLPEDSSQLLSLLATPTILERL